MTRSLDEAVAQAQRQWARERPDLDVAPMAVIGRLHRLGDRLRAEILAVYEAYGLGEGEFDVLAALRREGPPFAMPAGEIAEHTIVTSSAITKRVDRLEAAGLVTRRAAEADGRSRIVALTEAGRRCIDEAFAAHMRNEARLIAPLDATQRRTLEHLLSTWLAALEA